jgi:acyl carrier protein
MASNLEAEVIDVLAHERGLPRERIQLSDRLLQDLGMDGDDAVDFFMSLHERFGTDLTHLQEHWSEHFGPEGMSCWNALLIIPLGLVAGLLAAFAHSTFWGIVAAVAIFVAWVWVMHRWGPRDRMVPISVSDVVAAVEAGEWPART